MFDVCPSYRCNLQIHCAVFLLLVFNPCLTVVAEFARSQSAQPTVSLQSLLDSESECAVRKKWYRRCFKCTALVRLLKSPVNKPVRTHYMTSTLTLSVRPERFAIYKFPPDTTPPSWIFDESFYSISRTEDELSVVSAERAIPDSPDVLVERDWTTLKVEGPLDFALTGILSSLASPLANAGISIFAISTYDTDYLLVKKKQLEETITVLSNEGFRIQR